MYGAKQRKHSENKHNAARLYQMQWGYNVLLLNKTARLCVWRRGSYLCHERLRQQGGRSSHAGRTGREASVSATVNCHGLDYLNVNF